MARPKERNKEELMATMKEELGRLEKDYKNSYELDAFYRLYCRFIEGKDGKMDWNKIKDPKGRIVKYEDLKKNNDPSSLLSKLAVLKLNGGIGTTMGCTGPKGSIKLGNGKNFLENVIDQINSLKEKHGVDVPLVLMNSYMTDQETKKMLKNYPAITFTQSKFPGIDANTLLPIKRQIYYPSGHGDLLTSIVFSGVVDKLLGQGKEYLFVSNIDNLAATVDPIILGYVAENDIDFCIELTPKTRADVKGGTLVDYDGKLSLLEIAQVPPKHKREFQDINRFKIFNTNSVWISLRALKEVTEKNELELDIIQNTKKIDGKTVIQLETAIGAGVKYFPKNCGVVVPRSRFVPVKSCKDLFLLRSNLYKEVDGSVVINEKRILPQIPALKLDAGCFSSISKYEKAIVEEPDIVDLETLVVVGNVKFERNVTLRGTVIICSTDGDCITISEGSTLQDQVVINNISPYKLN